MQYILNAVVQGICTRHKENMADTINSNKVLALANVHFVDLKRYLFLEARIYYKKITQAALRGHKQLKT